MRLDGLTPAALEALFEDFTREGEARLERDGVPPAERRMLRSADLRYHGQSFELPVTVPPGPLTATDVERLRRDFHAQHERAYGYAAPEDAVELVNVRLAAIGVTPKPRRAPLPEGGSSAAPALKGRRDVWFAEVDGFRATRVLDRGKLLRGNLIDGPAIVEEPDARTLVQPGRSAAVDHHGTLELRATAAA
jgi:N-methylhydantoinase A